MTIKKSFSKYFFDFLMLFAAVTAGFWVENYREELNEKKKLSKKLQAFINEYDIVSDTAKINSYQNNYLIPFMEVLAAAQYNDTFHWDMEKLSFVNSQRNMLQSEFLDDLLRQSFMTDSDNYVHITDDSLTSFFLKLNDEFYVHERLREAVYKYDDSIVSIFNKHQVMDLLYNEPPSDSIELRIQKTFGSQLAREEKFKKLNEDENLKSLMGLIQLSHHDGHDLFMSVISNTRKNLKRIKYQIEELN